MSRGACTRSHLHSTPHALQFKPKPYAPRIRHRERKRQCPPPDSPVLVFCPPGPACFVPPPKSPASAPAAITRISTTNIPRRLCASTMSLAVVTGTVKSCTNFSDLIRPLLAFLLTGAKMRRRLVAGVAAAGAELRSVCACGTRRSYALLSVGPPGDCEEGRAPPACLARRVQLQAQQYAKRPGANESLLIAVWFVRYGWVRLLHGQLEALADRLHAGRPDYRCRKRCRFLLPPPAAACAVTLGRWG